MKSNIFNRFVVAVMIGAVALAGVATPAAAQGRADRAQREPRAEKVQKAKVQRESAAPKAVKVDRGVDRTAKQVDRTAKSKVRASEPVPVRRAQPRAIEDRSFDRPVKANRPVKAERPVLVDQKNVKSRVQAPVNEGRVTVDRSNKPVKVRRPDAVRSVDDSVIVRKPVKASPVRRPSDAVLPRTDRSDARLVRLPANVQRARIDENRTRISKYNDYLIRQQRISDQRRRELELQRRLSQARYMADYWRRLALQQQRVNSWQSYNYYNDPYFYTPANYRYGYGGNYYETNQYGANLLQQAINEGYREGYYAGRADRQDNWRYGYQNCYAYQDANYGYNGFYVSQSTYNYYFRQGFERGYEDGYYSRNHYGRNVGGTLAVLGAVIGTILVLDAIND